MKNIFTFSFLLVFAAIYGQKISDYRYISFPKEFEDAKANKYALADLLQQKLKAKKYITIKENQDISSEEMPLNPCEVLKTQIRDASNFIKNKIEIDFKDCNGNLIATFEGKSGIKEFEPGMRDALEKAVLGITLSNPNPQNLSAANVLVPETKTVSFVTPVKTEEKTTENAAVKADSVQKTENKAENKAEMYTNGILTLNRITISDRQFILANPQFSKPYAIFKASTKKEAYQVQLQDGTFTLGYFEEGKIIIETENADGSFRKEIFERK